MNIDSPTDRDWPRHGGDLTAAAARYGIPVDDWLDLSTGINPQPYPVPRPSANLYATLPDKAALGRLLVAARQAFQVAPEAAIAAVPGAEVAIYLAPNLVAPGPVVIFGPTYNSHQEAWEHAGRKVVVAGPGTSVPTDMTSAVIANPNNPDGRIVSPQALTQLAEMLAERGGMLLVDEAFADTRPNSSLCPLLDRVPAVVLRSFGKFYGLPGLRLGFVAGPARLVDRIARMLGDWPVSTAAIELGTTALDDADWREATRKRLAAEAHRLRGILMRHGMTVVGGTDLFVLASHNKAATIHRGLAEQAILTRAFRRQPEWLRFGLPAAGGFDRLDRALGEIATGD